MIVVAHTRVAFPHVGTTARRRRRRWLKWISCCMHILTPHSFVWVEANHVQWLNDDRCGDPVSDVVGQDEDGIEYIQETGELLQLVYVHNEIYRFLFANISVHRGHTWSPPQYAWFDIVGGGLGNMLSSRRSFTVGVHQAGGSTLFLPISVKRSCQ